MAPKRCWTPLESWLVDVVFRAGCFASLKLLVMCISDCIAHHSYFWLLAFREAIGMLENALSSSSESILDIKNGGWLHM